MMFLILNTISVVIMILITGLLSTELKKMKYSFYHVLASYAFWGDVTALHWMRRHTYYIWYFALIVALVLTGLSQIGLIFENKILTRPIFVFIVSPFLWLTIFFLLKDHSKRVNKNSHSNG